LAVPKHDAVS